MVERLVLTRKNKNGIMSYTGNGKTIGGFE
jgi:hypothetical protein